MGAELKQASGRIHVMVRQGGYRWRIDLLAKQIERVEMQSLRLYKRKGDCLNAAKSWANRLNIDWTVANRL